MRLDFGSQTIYFLNFTTEEFVLKANYYPKHVGNFLINFEAFKMHTRLKIKIIPNIEKKKQKLLGNSFDTDFVFYYA